MVVRFFHVLCPGLGPGFRQRVKNYTQLFDCISEINNTKADIAKDLDIAVSMYNLSEWSDNYFKTGNLWQYYRGKTNNALSDSESFKSKVKTARSTSNDG